MEEIINTSKYDSYPDRESFKRALQDAVKDPDFAIALLNELKQEQYANRREEEMNE